MNWVIINDVTLGHHLVSNLGLHWGGGRISMILRVDLLRVFPMGRDPSGSFRGCDPRRGGVVGRDARGGASPSGVAWLRQKKPPEN